MRAPSLRFVSGQPRAVTSPKSVFAAARYDVTNRLIDCLHTHLTYTSHPPPWETGGSSSRQEIHRLLWNNPLRPALGYMSPVHTLTPLFLYL